MVREHIAHRGDGTFLLERMVITKDGLVTRGEESGSWFVTAGLYEMRTEYLGREQLPNSQQLYATCRIESLTAKELVCGDDVRNRTMRQERVGDDFKL